MRAIAIPADQRLDLTVLEVGSTWQSIAAAVHARYIERVACTLTRDHSLVLVVDDSGRIDGKPYNSRADRLYGHGIYGDVLVMQEGVDDPLIGRDFVTLGGPEDVVVDMVRGALDRAPFDGLL
jgi:hypothetical protein